jgi:hypothetical protein
MESICAAVFWNLTFKASMTRVISSGLSLGGASLRLTQDCKCDVRVNLLLRRSTRSHK